MEAREFPEGVQGAGFPAPCSMRLIQFFQGGIIELAEPFQILFLLQFRQLGLQFLHDLGVALGVSLGFFLDGGSEFVGFLLSFLRRAGSRRKGGGGQKQGAGQQDPKFFYTYLDALDSGAVG